MSSRKRSATPVNDPAALALELRGDQAIGPSVTTAYDALMLEVGRVNALASHLAERLDDLSEGCHNAEDELYALSLVARQIIERNALVHAKADDLFRAAHEIQDAAMVVLSVHQARGEAA